MNTKERMQLFGCVAMVVAGLFFFAQYEQKQDKIAEEIVKVTPFVQTVQPEQYKESAPKEDKAYTAFDVDMLACAIYQEAGGDACSDETRLMVGCVVMNRVDDDRFPDTMEEVLTGEGQYGRFYWTGVQWPKRADKPAEQHAVIRSIEIAKRVLDGERVLTSDYIWQAEFPQSDDYIYQDGLYFCK